MLEDLEHSLLHNVLQFHFIDDGLKSLIAFLIIQCPSAEQINVFLVSVIWFNSHMFLRRPQHDEQPSFREPDIASV